MGSGKTYEVVSVVILNAVASGRRVITNIAGIDLEVIHDLLDLEGRDVTKAGTVVRIDNESVCNPAFWLSEKSNEHLKSDLPALAAMTESKCILPGDLLVLDEVWRFWLGFASKDGDGKKRPGEVMEFFRMHRHFTHSETGVSCDVALITQDVMDISRVVRAVVEETYLMTKLTAIGSTTRYRVDVCQGGQTRTVIRDLQRSYESKFFNSYTSHSGRKEGESGPKEQNIDGRGNILSGALFKFVIPIGLIVAGFAIWNVYGFFNPKPLAKTEKITSESNHALPTGELHPPQRYSSEPDVSSRWRVIGWVDNPFRVIISDGSNRRVIQPTTWKKTGQEIEAMLPNGETVTAWSGPSRSSFLSPEKSP